MRTKRTPLQAQLNQLTLDFYSLVEASAPPAKGQGLEPKAAPTLAPLVEQGVKIGTEGRRELGAAAAPDPTSAVEAKAPSLVTTLPKDEHFEAVIAAGVTFSNLTERPKGETTLLHYLVATDRVREVPAKWLNAEVLAMPDANGNTPCHFAAAKGTLASLPQAEFTPALLTTQNDLGQNMLHVAVEAKQLAAVPQNLLIIEALIQPDQANQTPVELAETSGQAELAPSPKIEVEEESVAQTNDTKLTNQAILAANLEYENLMMDTMPADEAGLEASEFEGKDEDLAAEIEEAAPAVSEEEAIAVLFDQYPKAEQVAKKPVEELTAEDLLVQDENGETPLFHAIYDGKLEALAPGIITEAACLIQDQVGNTAAHLLARYPKEVLESFHAALTERVLSTPDINNTTPAHEFAKLGLINHVPPEGLTQAVLLSLDDDGGTAYQYAIDCGVPSEVEVSPYAQGVAYGESSAFAREAYYAGHNPSVGTGLGL